MDRLTERDYWDKRYDGDAEPSEEIAEPTRRGIRGFLDRARNRVGVGSGCTYAGYLHHEVILDQLPENPDWSVFEVGCAPGSILLDFNRDFGYQPYGVDYSSEGVEVTRKIFEKRGFNPENVVEADFFSEEFLSAHEGKYNVVMSYGFIEHFDDPTSVLKSHARLLKEGGYLVCSIPNLTGFGYPFVKFFAPDVIDAHNLSIMRLEPYTELFSDLGLEQKTCVNAGTFAMFGITEAEHSKSGFIRLMTKLANIFTDLVDHVLFLVFRGRSFETRWSPYLIYVGQKPAPEIERPG
jgi:2-polyprenyl-3-methyl-5-hydroxy-6-metoxy-1,4-benzoquinol methylase